MMPFPVTILDSVDSTNAEAMRRIAGGERGPIWIMAREQTLGRGRSGRSWISVTGNHYASLLIGLDCKPVVAHHLSLVAGVAVVDAIRESANPLEIAELRLKWPNDVLFGGAKLAGILTESTSEPATGRLLAVIGIGINVESAPEDIARPATSLAAHGVVTTPEQLLVHLSTAMSRWLAIWENGNRFDVIRAAWLARAGQLDEIMSVNTGKGAVAGRFQGLDDDGALRLATGAAGDIRRFSFGDVTLGPGAAGDGRS
jgi:BirA family biotin operon repressor/biotin-[acetyl-CoA-carboxylase] ligase